MPQTPPSDSTESTDSSEIAVIGGSGFYEFLDDAEEVSVETPYGPPSAKVALGRVAGTPVAFLPRHGKGHEFPPHVINYRANMWALRSLGVRRILAPCAVGGLRDDVGPGDIVVPDQLVDRTYRRVQTYVDSGAAHVPFPDPYCPDLTTAVASADSDVKSGGTMVVVEGPRFSTRAESQHYAAQGWSLINMTGHPEAVLARELSMCYLSVALVTDMDAGVKGGESVSQEQVFAMFAENIERLKGLLAGVIEDLPARGNCGCGSWAEGIDLPFELPGGRG